MHRIDTSTAQVDKFGVGKNGFTGGNPQTGELPTALDADFFDSIQEEIASVIEGAGLVLNKANRSQLLAALNVLFPLGAAGKLGVATNTQMAAGTATNLLSTPAGVMSLFSKRSFGQNDFIRIPDVAGGLIIQWGYVTISSGSSVGLTFPTPFPTGVLNVQATNAANTTPAATPGVGGLSPTAVSLFGAKITDGSAAGAGASYYWFAIGR